MLETRRFTVFSGKSQSFGQNRQELVVTEKPAGAWVVLAKGSKLGAALVERLQVAGIQTTGPFVESAALASNGKAPLSGVICLFGGDDCPRDRHRLRKRHKPGPFGR